MRSMVFLRAWWKELIGATGSLTFFFNYSSQYPEKVCYQCDIFYYWRSKYFDLLRNQFIPVIRELNINCENILYQQGMCPGHSTSEGESFLQTTFSYFIVSTRRTMQIPVTSSEGITPKNYWNSHKYKIGNSWKYTKHFLWQVEMQEQDKT